MNSVSSQDQFAKWAKLRRRHDKTMEEYEAMSTCTTGYKTPGFFWLSRSLLTQTSHRQSPHFPENLIRLERQDRALAQHKRTQNLPSILVFQDARLCPPRRLVPILRTMDRVLPSRTAGLCEYPGLEQCLCGCYCACSGGSGCIHCTGGRPE
jgi:hypothetical protein